MTMMHYDNYDGAYGYYLISIRLYHPFLWEVVGFFAHYYHNYIDDDIDEDYDDDMMLIYCMMMMTMWMPTMTMHMVALLDPNWF